MDYLDCCAESFEPYLIYGDPAYGVLRWICSGFKGDISSQWGFCRMKMQWAFVTYKMQQKIMLQSVGKAINLAMLFTNYQTCYNGGNQSSQFFQLNPPSLKEYLTLG
ncbi:hypothetical protein H310_02439 [Aphanomyces invadans]|uniref:DDE Tnp4 domain-containing protein n=1 Tax=Aphanomyces invadans TaxID=157072 RepID=A0A024UPG7_9STRA|nr:hypothetical protein H310_02439 [Aphanomyces invadans]ETW08075.1 hypothetical protein H310_02439 [Aphanomyces invadans]|eukprot:XP_008864168.1 hypothetical protein H310_02439 [Aphanomyces invadans]